jgi:hypothetical protein
MKPAPTALLLFGLAACGPPGTSDLPTTKGPAPQEIHNASYDLIIPTEQKALLILFPCFGCDAADTRSGSKITDEAVANGIAVLLMNFNGHIMMSDAELQHLITTIEQAFTVALSVKEQGLNGAHTFIGGFSSGGNVTMLLARALLKDPDPPVTVKGVFAVDSPLDLVHLYEASKRGLERPGFPQYKDEGRMVVTLLDVTLGDPATNAAAYEAASPLMPTRTSVAPLKDLPVRLYTEPDTAWWRVNRGDSYEDMNAYALARIHASLKAAGNMRAEYITTQDRGIQHGHRHPHAWSIVDEKELVKWIGSNAK